jgi:hypothetical protein
MSAVCLGTPQAAPPVPARAAPPVSWPALALVVVAFVALAGAYSVAIPAYETNDEPWHYAYVRGLALLIAGWWYVRNALLYGDPLAIALQQEMGRPILYPRSLTDPYFVTHFPLVTFLSFFAVFGWLSLYVWLPVYLFYGLVVAYALAGLAYLWLRPLPALQLDSPARQTVMLSIAYVGLLYAGLMHYNLSFSQPQGRLLFPALGAVALLVVLGWQRLCAPWPALQRRALFMLPLASAAIAVALLVGKVAPAYATTHG